LVALPAHAANTSCAVVAKSGAAALANARIHQAAYMPAKGAKPPTIAEQLGHFIVIDKTTYTSVLFSRVLFGDTVKAPVYGAKKGLLGTPAAVDAQALVALSN
jgi:hypothetical protein